VEEVGEALRKGRGRAAGCSEREEMTCYSKVVCLLGQMVHKMWS
jgi:hypothetical protein